MKAQHESMVNGLFCHLATPRFEGWPVDLPAVYWQSISELQNPDEVFDLDHSCQMLSLGRLLSFGLALGLRLRCLGHRQLTIGLVLFGFAFQSMGPQRWPQQPSTLRKNTGCQDAIGNLFLSQFLGQPLRLDFCSRSFASPWNMTSMNVTKEWDKSHGRMFNLKLEFEPGCKTSACSSWLAMFCTNLR